MWWLLTEHHIPLGDYYRMPAGEKLLHKAYYVKTMEDRRDARWLGM